MRKIDILLLMCFASAAAGHYISRTNTKGHITGQNEIDIDTNDEYNVIKKTDYIPDNEYVPADVGFEADAKKDEQNENDDEKEVKDNNLDGEYNPEDFKGEAISLKRKKKSIRHLNNCRSGRRIAGYRCIG